MGLAGAMLGLTLAACIDFVAVDLAEIGAPAVIEATLRLTDRGEAELDARLAPGLDVDGYRRTAHDDTIEVLGRRIAPDSLSRSGTRRYIEAWKVDPAAVAEPALLLAPSVDRVQAARPAVAWAGVRRIGPDTIDASEGDDVMLRISAGTSMAGPMPDVRQWFLRMEGDSTAFGISADGPPPDTIIVPARWIPRGRTIEVRLIFSQSAVLQPPPGDYVGLVTLDTRTFWTLRLRDASSASRWTRPATKRTR